MGNLNLRQAFYWSSRRHASAVSATQRHAKLAACSANKPSYRATHRSRPSAALSHNRFSVTPLQEGWQTLRLDETRALGVPAQAQGWVREVFLRGHDQPWVYARSVAARSTLEGSGLALDQLGSRSLGELLFSDRAFQRGDLEVTRYPAAWLPAEVRSEQLWARRSCFRRGELAVLVAEVFLPALWQAAEQP